MMKSVVFFAIGLISLYMNSAVGDPRSARRASAANETRCLSNLVRDIQDVVTADGFEKTISLDGKEYQSEQFREGGLFFDNVFFTEFFAKNIEDCKGYLRGPLAEEVRLSTEDYGVEVRGVPKVTLDFKATEVKESVNNRLWFINYEKGDNALMTPFLCENRRALKIGIEAATYVPIIVSVVMTGGFTAPVEYVAEGFAKKALLTLLIGTTRIAVKELTKRAIVAAVLKAVGRRSLVLLTPTLLGALKINYSNAGRNIHSLFNSDFAFGLKNDFANLDPEMDYRSDRPEDIPLDMFTCFSTTIVGNGCYAACNRKDLATVDDFMNKWVFNNADRASNFTTGNWTPTRVCVDPDTYILRKIENGRPGEPFLLTRAQWLSVRYWLRIIRGHKGDHACRGFLIDPRNNFDAYVGYPIYTDFTLDAPAAVIMDGLRIRD